MLEYVLMGAAGVAIFGIFFLVMSLREKRAETRPSVHTCGQGHGCRCQGQLKDDLPTNGNRDVNVKQFLSESKRKDR